MNEHPNCNPLENGAAGEQANANRQPANGAAAERAATEPLKLIDAELMFLWNRARGAVLSGYQSEYIRDFYNLSYTAIEDRRLNVEHRDIMNQTHDALGEFERAMNIKPRIGQTSADRITVLRQLSEHIAAEREHFAALLNYGEGFEHQSARYVSMYLGEQGRFESFPLPPHVRARAYLGDLKRRLNEFNDALNTIQVLSEANKRLQAAPLTPTGEAELAAVKNELRLTSKLRDSVAQNFDDLHAASLEALRDAYTRAGYGSTAPEQAWRALDEAYARQCLKRAQEAPQGAQEASEAGEGARRPQEGAGGAGNRVTGQEFEERWVHNPNAEPFEPRIYPQATQEGVEPPPINPMPIMDQLQARARVEEQRRRNSEICHYEKAYSLGGGAIKRIDELQRVSPDCPHVLIDGVVQTLPPKIGNIEINEVEPRGGRRQEGIAARFVRQAEAAHADMRAEDALRRNAEATARSGQTFGRAILNEAMRIGFDALKTSAAAKSELAAFIDNLLIGVGNAQVVGATDEAIDDLLKLERAIIREARNRKLPHETAMVAAGAAFARLDAQTLAVTQCEQAYIRAHEMIVRYAPAINGTLAHRIEKLARAMQEEIDERNAWLRDIRNALAGFLPLISGEEYDDVSPDSDAILPRRLRAILAELDQSRIAAEQTADGQLRALEAIRATVEREVQGMNRWIGALDATHAENVAQEVEAAVERMKSELQAARDAAANNIGRADSEQSNRRAAEGERDIRAGALCQVTHTQTFGAAMSEVRRLQTVESNAINQLRILIGEEAKTFPTSHYIGRMIEILGERLHAAQEAQRVGFETADTCATWVQEAHAILNVHNVPNDRSKDEGGQTIAERLAAYLPAEGVEKRRLQSFEFAVLNNLRVALNRRADDDGSQSAALGMIAELSRRAAQAEQNAREIEAAREELWGFIVPPEFMHDIRQAKTLADAINVFNNARIYESEQDAQIVANVKRALVEYGDDEGDAPSYYDAIRRIGLQAQEARQAHQMLTADGVEFFSLPLPERLKTVLQSLHSFRESEQEARREAATSFANADSLARENGDANAVLRSMQMPPLDRARMDVAETLAERITILNEVRVAHVRVLAEESKRASEILLRIEGMPQNVPLIKLAERALMYANAGNVEMFAEYAANALIQRHTIIAARGSASGSYVQLTPDDIQRTIREWIYGNAALLPQRPPATFDDVSVALKTLRAVSGVPQQQSLTATAEFIAAMATRRAASQLAVCIVAARKLLNRYKIVGVENDMPTTEEHLGRWLIDFMREAQAEIGEPKMQSRGGLTRDDCFALAQSIKREYVVLRSAPVMNANDGASDDELAQSIFAAVASRDAEQEG